MWYAIGVALPFPLALTLTGILVRIYPNFVVLILVAHTKLLTSRAIDAAGSSNMYLCCLRICSEPGTVSEGILLGGSLIHTFFLLQATQAVGALNGGGLNRAIPRFPAHLTHLYRSLQDNAGQKLLGSSVGPFPPHSTCSRAEAQRLDKTMNCLYSMITGSPSNYRMRDLFSRAVWSTSHATGKA